MWAYKAAGYGESSTFYQCPITVRNVTEVSNNTPVANDTHVSNVRRKSQMAWPVSLLRRWPCRVALQATIRGYNTTFILLGNLQPPLGFRFAQLEEPIVSSSSSAGEIHFKAHNQVGADMAEFAIGSMSTMAPTNRHIQVDSLVPHLASPLEVKWYCVYHELLVFAASNSCSSLNRFAT